MNNVAHVLPADAVQLLIKASTTGPPALRIFEIERAERAIQFKYPQFFKKDSSHENKAQ